MPHKVVNRKGSGWQRALADAKQQLDAAKRRVKELQIAVRVCEQRVAAGEPFPTEDRIIGQGAD